MLVWIGAAQNSSQSGKTELTARELYYAAAAPAASAPKQAAAQPAVKTPAPKTNITPPKPVVADAPPNQPVSPSNPKPSAPGSVELPGGAKMVRTSAPAPVSGTPLGLKYTVLKLVNGEMQEVPADTAFHAGDRIRFNVETNSPGYLYIIAQGSSGTWKAMFPSAEIADGNNHVEGFHAYTMPPGSRFYFDEQPGTERVFIVFSREPETDLEKMIYGLQGAKAKPASAPAAAPATSERPNQTLIASAAIDNSTVGKLRSAYARDLVIETVNETTPGDRKEKAVYLVNPSGSNDSRVVADLALVHK